MVSCGESISSDVSAVHMDLVWNLHENPCHETQSKKPKKTDVLTFTWNLCLLMLYVVHGGLPLITLQVTLQKQVNDRILLHIHLLTSGVFYHFNIFVTRQKWTAYMWKMSENVHSDWTDRMQRWRMLKTFRPTESCPGQPDLLSETRRHCFA